MRVIISFSKQFSKWRLKSTDCNYITVEGAMYQSERCNYNGQVQTEHNVVSFNTMVRHEINPYLRLCIVFTFQVCKSRKWPGIQGSIDTGGST